MARAPGRSLRFITIPLLQRTTTLIIILQVLASLKVFDQIYLFTNGGPEGITRSALEYIYETGFQSYRLGYAAAMSYIFFVLILIISALQFVVFSRGRGRTLMTSAGYGAAHRARARSARASVERASCRAVSFIALTRLRGPLADPVRLGS